MAGYESVLGAKSNVQIRTYLDIFSEILAIVRMSALGIATRQLAST